MGALWMDCGACAPNPGACCEPYIKYLMVSQSTGKDKMICEDFKDELLDKLNELRETNVLCDTTIRAEGHDFPAHKCVLSAASAYFIYTGKANIDSSNAEDLAVIADYLIIPSLKTRASDFLESLINASNCFALESFASRYNCESLKQAAITYKCENFLAVTKSEDFSKLDVEKVKELICMDEINVSEEDEVYQAMIAWIQYDIPSRECFLPDLLKCVRLFSVSKYSLGRILDDELVSKNFSCTRLIINSFLFPYSLQNVPLKPRLSIDKYEHVVVLTGGKYSFALEMSTDCFVPPTNGWGSLPKMPYPCEEGGAAVCGGILYVMGGKKEDSSRVMCHFNPKHNQWSSHDIAINIVDSSVTCFNEELYVIGGKGSWQDVQIYNPVSSEWRTAASMATGRAGQSAVVLQGHIYVIAGHDGEVCLNSVECYNPFTDQWSIVSNLSKARRCAAATTADQRIIIVVGGFGDMTVRTIEPSCEIYDPITNQWNLMSSPGIPRAACSAVCIDDIVYLFGGESETEYLRSVECFDIKRNRWCEIEAMPNTRSHLQASLLKLPKKFIQ